MDEEVEDDGVVTKVVVEVESGREEDGDVVMGGVKTVVEVVVKAELGDCWVVVDEVDVELDVGEVVEAGLVVLDGDVVEEEETEELPGDVSDPGVVMPLDILFSLPQYSGATQAVCRSGIGFQNELYR